VCPKGFAWSLWHLSKSILGITEKNWTELTKFTEFHPEPILSIPLILSKSGPFFEIDFGNDSMEQSGKNNRRSR